MAVVGESNLTLLDIAKRTDPNGNAADIAELLAQTNDIIGDIPWQEANEMTGHRMTVRASLPTTYWRQLNQAVAPSKSTTAQITEGIGNQEAYSVIDVDVAELNGNSAEWRKTEIMPFIEKMGQEFTRVAIYGNSGVNPEQFHGLANRYDNLSSQNVLTGGGSGSDNSSIWLIAWKKGLCHGIYPKGSVAGLRHKDLGDKLIQGSTGISGSLLQAYVDHFQWKAGLAIKDWRQVVRGCNIDISNLVGETSAAVLQKLMYKMIFRLPDGALQTSKAVFYMNRTVFQMLGIQRRADVVSGGGLNFENVDGKIQADFMGIPIRLVDQITNTEATVS
jgi:hypothetical protein